MSDLVGPEIPPHILAKRKRKAEEEATRVAAAAATSTSPTPPSDSDAPKKRRTVGPAPPPAPLDERPTAPPDGGTRKDDDGDSSSDDDDIGPSLPVPGATEDEELAAQARLARFADPEKPTTDDSKPKRDEWMLVPPSSEDWATKVDPTKLKNRKFQTGKGAKAPAQRGAGGSGASVLWTETPEERRKRLEDEVMGVKKPATQGGGTDADDKKRAVIDREREETARRIREFNVSYSMFASDV